MRETVRHIVSSLGMLEPNDWLAPVDPDQLDQLVSSLASALGIDATALALPRDGVRSLGELEHHLELALGRVPGLATVLQRTTAMEARATTHQQMFWWLDLDNRDAGWWVRADIAMEGRLDRDALGNSLNAFVQAHSIFRTSYAEVDGQLHMTVLDADAAPPLELADEDVSAVAEADRARELDAGVRALARNLAVPRGRVLQAKLARLAPHRHVLQLVVHHIAADLWSLDALVRLLADRYAQQCDGITAHARPALQFVDYAVALARLPQTREGSAAVAYWDHRLRDLVPVDVAGDVSRASVDRRRHAARHGLTSSPMLPRERVEFSTLARASVAGLVRDERAPTAVVFLAALIWCLHRETGQTDICIEVMTNVRGAHADTRDLQGTLTTWQLYRVNVAGCATLREVVRQTKQAAVEVAEHPIIDNYYMRVPHIVRRVVFHFRRLVHQPPPVVAGLQMALRTGVPAGVSAELNRPWDLHVAVSDGAAGPQIWWCGSAEIFTPARLSVLVHRYAEILATAD